jgi:pyrroline-5-carboxylate reductase
MNNIIGFIGAGNMAEAIINGIISKSVYEPDQIYISERREEQLNILTEKYVINKFDNNIELVKNSDIIVLAVKPQSAFNVLDEVKEVSGFENKIFVSIMAGKTIAFIKSSLEQDVKVVRVMPNTPALLGEGMSALVRGENITDEEFEKIIKIFDSVGKTIVLDEDKMNSVTAVSGSGPAYVYYFAEALIKSAVELGLSDTAAELLVKQTIFGAATMLKESQDSAELLREKVSSPGGTTVAGIETLNECNFLEIIEKAVVSAKKRAEQLS